MALQGPAGEPSIRSLRIRINQLAMGIGSSPFFVYNAIKQIKELRTDG